MSKNILPDPKLAEAVEVIVRNCGAAAHNAICCNGRPMNRKAILELSRTSPERQRYRVDGVLAGRFKTIKIQGDDPVFDTVAFKEVPSRLWRARGSLALCQRLLRVSVPQEIAAECHVLADACRKAARQLTKFLSASKTCQFVIPQSLSRKRIQPLLDRRTVRGNEVGRARAALKLVVKNVWDFPGIIVRGMLPTPAELERSRRELATIKQIAMEILNNEP